MFQKHCKALSHRKALVVALSFALSSTLLVGCSGKKEREAKYLHRADEYLSQKNYDKARIEAKNALQINANSAEARYVFAEIAEHEHNWPQMYAELNSAIENNPKLIKAHLKLAQLLAASNQLDKAKAEAEKIKALAPNSADYYAVLATIAARQKNTDEAIKDAQKALEIEPGHLGASTILASIYANTDPEKAIQALDTALKANPDEAESLLVMKARVYAKANQPDNAIKTMQDVINKHPEKTVYIGQLADYYMAQKRPDDAEALLRQSIKNLPDNSDLKIALVEFIAKQRSKEEAVELLEKYNKAEPDNYKLRTALARLYLATNLPDKAIETYQYTIDKDIHGEGIDARNQVIKILLAEGKRPRAESLLKDVLKLEPENPDALMTRARLELTDNQPDNAIADLRSILKNEPDSPQALMLLGLAQERTGALDLALNDYQKVLDKNGDDIGALLGAARLEIRQNQLDDAQKLLEHARSLAGTNTEVASLLVNLYARKQQWQQAFELCDQLTLNSKSAAMGYYLKGAVQLRKNDTKEGIDSLKKALEKEPRAMEPLQLLISAYVGTKQTDTATKYLENFIKAYPKLVNAQELLGALYRQTGKLSQSERILEGVVNNEPQLMSGYRELAATYVAAKQPQKVEALLSNALKKYPDNSDLLLLQAQYANDFGKNQLALDSYNKALKLQPDSQVIKNNLAVLLIEKFPTDDNLNRAQDLTAGFADSSNPLFVDTYAWLQYKMKNYQQAVSLLQSVLKDNMQAPELRYHLGMAYLKSGDKDKAKIELTKATATKAQYSGRAEAEAELKKL